MNALAILLTILLVTTGPTVPEQIIQRLQAMTPEEAVAMGYGWEIPGQYVQCAGALPVTPGEVPVLACQWGPGANVPLGRALIWQEGQRWRSQPYPEAGVWGTAGFSRLYQSGDELIVIMNVGIAQTRYAEQPQLLRRTAEGWQLVWVPERKEWSQFLATVQFQGDALNRFTVITDRFALPEEQRWPFVGEFGQYLERWERRGDRYERISRTEAPHAQMAVFHFIQAVARGDEAEAARWATEERLVGEARTLGVPGAAAAGFVQPVRLEGEAPLFRVSANNYERQPEWLVTVTRQAGRWVVSDIKPTK